jgi:peptidoglycan/xylan/chitin deacetylase (PgdA/CDA1 family)
MKRLIRQLVRLLGVLHMLRFCNRRKVTILSLHGVAGDHPEAGWQPLWPRVAPEELDSVLGQLGQYYEFVSLDEAVAMISGSSPVRNHSLALTFDDGYRNNITEAWPVLKKHGAPATFFVSTGYIETGRAFWIDRLDYALQKSPDDARLVAANGASFDLRGLSREQLGHGYRKLRLGIKNEIRNDQEMLAAFDSLSASLEAASGQAIGDVIDSDPYASVANWQEFEMAAADGVIIGSHSVDHNRLDAIPRGSVDAQLLQSKAEIENHLNLDCRYFCFPNGSFDDFVLQQTESAGYSAAVTTVRGLNKVGDGMFSLKRYAMPSKENAFDNLLSISGFFELPVVRRFLGSNS